VKQFKRASLRILGTGLVPLAFLACAGTNPNDNSETATSQQAVDCGGSAEQWDVAWTAISAIGTPGQMAASVGSALTSILCGDEDAALNELIERMRSIARNEIDADKLNVLKTKLEGIAQRLTQHNPDQTASLATDLKQLEAEAVTTLGIDGFEIQMSLAIATAAVSAEYLAYKTRRGTATEVTNARSQLIDALKTSQQWINARETAANLDVRLKAGSFSRIDAHTERRGNFRWDTWMGRYDLWAQAMFDGPDGHTYRSKRFTDSYYAGLDGVKDKAKQDLLPAYHDVWTAAMSELVRKIETTRQSLLKLAGQAGVSRSDYTDLFADTPLPPSGLALQASKAFMGTDAYASIATTDPEKCERFCLEDATCSGGTFNSERQMCWLRVGSAAVRDSTPSESAFVITTTAANKYFTSLMAPKRSYAGTGSLRNLATASSAECYRACLKDDNCSGGTFNASARSCQLRTGSSNVADSANSSDYAFVLEGARRNNHYDLRMRTGLCAYGGSVLGVFISMSSQECYSRCQSNPACAGGIFYVSDDYCVHMERFETVESCNGTERTFFFR
jgi:hypothetical protein